MVFALVAPGIARVVCSGAVVSWALVVATSSAVVAGAILWAIVSAVVGTAWAIILWSVVSTVVGTAWASFVVGRAIVSFSFVGDVLSLGDCIH